MRRLVALAVLVGAGQALASPPPAAAANECGSFLVCIPVAGPWVVVPTGSRVPRPQVVYQLACPRGWVVGGLDAQLSQREISISFEGNLGTPVNPGITTSRTALFVASYVGATARAPTFRPHVGCIPTSGGRTGRVPTSVSAVFPPGLPAVRRVTTTQLRPGTGRRVTRGCAAGERLVGGSHAIGFRTDAPPPQRLVGSVGSARRLSRGRVLVTARADAALRGVRAVVQVHALCVGGR